MLQSEAIDFFSKIELSPALRPVPFNTLLSAPSSSLPGDLVEAGKANGAVIGDAVVGLTDRLSEQNAKDVMNCISLAQQYANQKANKEAQLGQWFDAYFEVLRYAGWNTRNYARQQYSPSARSFSMDQIALEIIQAASQGQFVFVEMARQAFGALQNNEKALSILENNNASETFATFQTLPCTETTSGVPAMIMTCIDFKKKVSQRKVLFFRFNRSDVDIYRAATQIELNTYHYGKIRNQIEDKLHKTANDFFEGINL
ncbi:hypothetical protein G7007_05575 [Pseudomonas entomophila]|uniref:hypothetical protein n=1 Tax=Pseudomonas entomophila TaxID=312306 RepID=UPI0015E4079F|nr:hypothetical protein [Pseudomonas entomophila]MBA1192334.1 hypothetical protein [Pseudomonas entomophila]